MMSQILGRFGRLRKTLSEEKNKVKIPDSQGNIAFKSNQGVVATPSETSEDFEQISLVIAWLAICLSEGHIEPSQPCIGRIVGWPLRPFFKNSLYVDFELWCFKKNLPRKEVSRRELFYSLVDRILISEGDKYHFPPLEECIKKFETLKEGFYGRA